jgi:hypothetical protein
MNINKDVSNIVFAVGCMITAGCLSFIFVYYASTSSFKRDELMAKNIETAISKGVDPLAVRCSYAASTDQICIMYAAGMKTITSAAK